MKRSQRGDLGVAHSQGLEAGARLLNALKTGFRNVPTICQPEKKKQSQEQVPSVKFNQAGRCQKCERMNQKTT